jgi:hypothetical protein
MSLFLPELQALQNAGVVVLMDIFQELDVSGMWWNNNMPGNVQAALWPSVEHYYESQGIHNVLYGYTILRYVNGSYPGAQYIDWLGIDLYPPAAGGNYVDPVYANIAPIGSQPIISPEYDAPGGSSNSGDFDGMLNNYKTAPMPRFIGQNWWWGLNPATKSSNSSWKTMMQDAYSIMQGSLNIGGAPTPTPLPTVRPPQFLRPRRTLWHSAPWSHAPCGQILASDLRRRVQRLEY